MNNKDVEKRYASALERTVPDVHERILSECKPRKGKVIYMTKNRTLKTLAAIAATAAALLLVIGGVYALTGVSNAKTVSTVVALDVNPSVEIKLNNSEKVLAVDALNADGTEILSGMDFSGASLEVTINAIIGSMLRHGYITELANSVLITVDSNDPSRGLELEERLVATVNEILSQSAISGAITGQSAPKDSQAETLASQYGISTGKVALIQSIIAADPTLLFEDLAGLSINELNLIAEYRSAAPENTVSTGAPSESGYIGREKALIIALADAGLAEADIFGAEVELDRERGVMVYEVEFHTDGLEYDYHIDAVSGAIISAHSEPDDDYRPQNTQTAPAQPSSTASAPADAPAATPAQSSGNSGNNTNDTAYIGRDSALSIALGNAGVKTDAARDIDVELDRDDGTPHYEVDFYANGLEYEYDIDASTGAILRAHSEVDDDHDDGYDDDDHDDDHDDDDDYDD